MTEHKQVMQQALEALAALRYPPARCLENEEKAIAALQAALVDPTAEAKEIAAAYERGWNAARAQVTDGPVALTDEQIEEIGRSTALEGAAYTKIAHAILAAAIPPGFVVVPEDRVVLGAEEDRQCAARQGEPK